MTKFLKFSFLALLMLTCLTSCYRVSPDAGVESVLVSKPMFFGHGGVDPVPVNTGSTWVAMTTDHTVGTKDCESQCERKVVMTPDGPVIVCDGCDRIVMDNRKDK